MPEFPEFDSGHWTVTYRQTGPLTLRRDETGGEALIRALGGLGTPGRGAPSLSQVTGSAYEACEDGSRNRYTTEYEPPVRIEPGTVTVSSEGALVHLWYSIPIVEMHHPGHGHIPDRSECHTMDPGSTELWLFTSELEAAGARTNEYGELLIFTVPWDDLVAASQGRRESLVVRTSLQAPGTSFEVRGTIGPREAGG